MGNDASGELIIDRSKNGKTQIDVRLGDENISMPPVQLVELYQSCKSNVREHIQPIFEEGELDSEVGLQKFRIITQHGSMGESPRKAEQNSTILI